jgi:hypothetical protein
MPDEVAVLLTLPAVCCSLTSGLSPTHKFTEPVESLIPLPKTRERSRAPTRRGEVAIAGAPEPFSKEDTSVRRKFQSVLFVLVI